MVLRQVVLPVCLVSTLAAPAASASRDPRSDPAPEVRGSEVFDLRDPKRFAAALHELGYRALMDRTDNGSPKIESRAAGIGFSFLFGSCTKMRECGHVLVVASWNLGRASDPLPALNTWNNTRNYGRAWYDEDNDVVGIDVTWNLVGDVTLAALEDQIAWWSDSLEEYQKFIREEFGKDEVKEKSDASSRDI